MSNISVGILTVSTSCCKGEKVDLSGPELSRLLNLHLPDFSIKYRAIVSDDKTQITQTLASWISDDINLILTTGGTGLSPMDVTPEATLAVIERDIPAMQFGILSKSLAVTPMAMLSRAICGVAKKSLIINLPGSLKASSECLMYVTPCIPHALDLILDKKAEITKTHEKVQAEIVAQKESKVQTDNVAERPRVSPYPIVEIGDALNLIIKEAKTPKTETVSLKFALNRVLAENVTAPGSIPAFDASIKDGYAVLSSDPARVRKVKSVAAAGDVPDSIPLKHGEAVRISTGAPIPLGADAVIQIEDTRVVKKAGGLECDIEITRMPVGVGQDVRKKGSDIGEGELVMLEGEVIKAANIGVLATVGKATVKVYRVPQIGIITTGNELRDPSESLAPGKIYDSNRCTIINLLQEHHYDCNDCGIVCDNPDDINKAFKTLFDFNDVIITTGGVSMGEFDYIKRVLEVDFGAIIHFGRVNMKPGKPTTFSTCMHKGEKKMIFSLPGNPVSASVTCLLFVIPTIKYLERNCVWKFPILPYVVTKAKESCDKRPEYVRVTVSMKNGKIIAEKNGSQMSSRLNSMIGANGLMVLPGDLVPGKEYLSHIMMFGPMNF